MALGGENKIHQEEKKKSTLTFCTMANSHASGRRQTLSMSVSRFHTAQTNLMLNKKAFTTKKKLVKFNIIFFSSRSEQQAFSTFLASFTLLCNFTSITN